MMNFNLPLILASNSPRRQQLLRDMGFDFVIKAKDVDENYPSNLPSHEVAKYLAQKKAQAYLPEIDNEIIITADTIVKLGDEILGKPANEDDAKLMLQALSGKAHEVITGVCIASKEKQVVFDHNTRVYFKNLSEEEIQFYITHYRPFDKAGAYGIQEWIGMVGVEKIEGSYFNVVGLPVHQVYDVLLKFNS